MDDKTAAIPSLKDFKGNKKSDNSAKKTQSRKPKADASTRKILSQDTMRIDSIKSTKKTSQKNSTAGRTATRSTSSANTRQKAKSSQTKSRSDYDASRRVERSPQAQRKASMQAPRKPQPAKRPSSSYYDDIEPVRKTSTASRTQQRPTQTTKPERKPYVPKKTVQRKPVAKKSTRRPVTKLPKEERQKREKTPESIRKEKIIIAVVSLIAVSLLIFVLSLTVFFKAQEFTVKGVGVYTKEELIKASGITASDNIFSVSKKNAEERIESICPYVESADVYSIFPNGIGIEVKIAEPACKFEGIGGVYLISDKGKVLDVSNHAEDFDVPMIEGVAIDGKPKGEFVDFGSEVLSDAVSEMFTAFKELQSKNITKVTITEKGDIFELRYVYDDRIIVYLGIPEEITYKLKAADSIVKRLDGEDGTAISGELDVSTCHESTKSYFNEFSIIPPDEAATESATESATGQN